MHLKNFRDAQLMSYMLSYVCECPAIIKNHNEEWFVQTDPGMRCFDDPDDETWISLFQNFNTKKSDKDAVPSWWNKKTLEEISALQSQLAAPFLARYEAERAIEMARKNELEENMKDPEFVKDWQKTVEDGYRWEGDHWVPTDSAY